MPWSAWVILVALGLVAIPAIGEYAAVLIVFVIAMPLGRLYVPVVQLGQQFGLAEGTTIAVAIGVAVFAIVLVAGFLVSRWQRPDVTAHQEAVYANGLILVLGVAPVIAVSYWRLRGLWG